MEPIEVHSSNKEWNDKLNGQIQEMLKAIDNCEYIPDKINEFTDSMTDAMRLTVVRPMEALYVRQQLIKYMNETREKCKKNT